MSEEDAFYGSALAFWCHVALTVAAFAYGHWILGLLLCVGLCRYTAQVKRA